MGAQGTKGNKHKYKGRNVGPSRDHYWATNRLKAHKVKNLMRHNGLTRAEAEVLWTDPVKGRKTRMRTGSARPSILDSIGKKKAQE